MRAIIATDFEGHLRKLIWLTEKAGTVGLLRTPNERVLP